MARCAAGGRGPEPLASDPWRIRSWVQDALPLSLRDSVVTIVYCTGARCHVLVLRCCLLDVDCWVAKPQSLDLAFGEQAPGPPTSPLSWCYLASSNSSWIPDLEAQPNLQTSHTLPAHHHPAALLGVLLARNAVRHLSFTGAGLPV